MKLKLSKKVRKYINLGAITSLVATGATLVGVAINNEVHKDIHREYSGNIVSSVPEISETKKHINFTVQEASIDFGSNKILKVDLNELTNAFFRDDNNATKLHKISDDLMNKFVDTRRKTGKNATLTIKTNLLKFTNNYLDIFNFYDSFEFLQWFADNVAWGPEIRSLSRFSIVRGVNKSGKAIVLGGREGNREEDRIQFYPDSVFGAQKIYDPFKASNGVITDTSDINLTSNNGIKNSFLNEFVDGTLKQYWDKLKTSDFEDDEELIENIFTKKIAENYLEIFSRETDQYFNSSKFLGGDLAYANSHTLPGNFTNFKEFLIYLSSQKEIKKVDSIKNPDGTERTIFPRRFMRRALFSIYGYSSLRYGVGNNPNSLSSFDKARKDRGGDTISSKPEDVSKNFKLITGFDNSEGFSMPVMLSSFNGFSSAVPEDTAVRITKYIYQWTKIKPFKETKVNTRDSEGKNYLSVLYEKEYGLIDAMKRYKQKYGWAPVPFDAEGNVSVNSYIPNVYLWKDEKIMTSKGLFDLNSTLNKNDPELIKMDKQLRTPVDSIGMTWIKYIANHEYGHHQTLNYASDLSNSFDRTEDNISLSRQTIALANPFRHSYSDTYSKDFISNWLLSRTGGGNLDPSKFNPLTVQYSKDSSKWQSSFVFLDKNGHVMNPQIDGKDAPEKLLSEYKDFANSWRGFKTIYEMANNLPKGAIDIVRSMHNENEPSSILNGAYTMNALDEASYSLNPSLFAVASAFKRGEHEVVDTMLVPKYWNDFVRRKYIYLDGWDDHSKGEALTPEQHYVATAKPTDWKFDRLDSSGDPVKDKSGAIIRDAPTFAAAGFRNALASLYDFTRNQNTSGSLPSINWNSDTNNPKFTKPTTGIGSTNPLIAELSAKGITKESVDFYYDSKSPEHRIGYRTDFSSTGDPHYASTWVIKLPYTMVDGHKVYYSPNAATPKPGTQIETTSISSGSFSSFMGRILQKPIWLVINDQITEKYNISHPDDPVNTLLELAEKITLPKVEEQMWDFIITEINKTSQRRLAVNISLPQTQSSGVATKGLFIDWFKKLYGLISNNKEQNNVFLSNYGETVFKKFLGNFGRFMPYASDSESTTQAGYRPNSIDILNFYSGVSGSAELNNAYNLYLSTGAFPFVGSTMSDYQATLAEQITRDLAQLTYVPDSRTLQDGVSTEEYDTCSFSLPPIIVPLWQENGAATVLHGTGKVDLVNRRITNSTNCSGFWEDYAVRRSLDSDIYRIKAQSRTSDPIAHSDDFSVYDESGAKTGTVFDNLQGKGHYISQTGKAYLNFLEKQYGIAENQDLSSITYNKKTGFGSMIGYVPQSVKDAGYNKIAFVAPNGDVKYLDMHFGYSNQKFNLLLGRADTRLSMLDYYFDENGHLVKRADPQVAWTSDDFLASGFSNTFLKPDVEYNIYFTKGQDLASKRDIGFGSVYRTEYDETTQTYKSVEKELHWIMNNMGDFYTSLIQANREDNESATLVVKG